MSAQLDALGEETPHMQSARHDVSTLVRDVVFHACLWIYRQLNLLVDGTPQAAVILASILIVGVVLGVVNVVCVARQLNSILARTLPDIPSGR